MRNFKDFTRAIAGIASALKGINTIVDDIPVPGGGAGGLDYSTTEQDTGLKWIDGKSIYQKSIEISSLPNNTTATLEADASYIDTLIKYEGAIIGDTSQGAGNRCATFGPSGGTNDIRIKISSADVMDLISFSTWTGYSAVATIYYTKSE